MSAAPGLVAAGHRETARAAAEVLRAGGNAFDAAIAAGVASAMAEPVLTGLGGGGFLLARPAGRQAVLFDFFVDTPGRGRPPSELDPHFLPVTVSFPGSDQVFNTGMGSAAVPGVVAGYLCVHERLGRLPLAEVLAPGRRLAEEGVVLDVQQAEIMAILWPILGLTEDGRRLYGPEGRSLAAGERFVNPDLVTLLDGVATSGRERLYGTAIAERVASDMDGTGGLLTAIDLTGYEVAERAPLAAEYRGRTVLTNPPPSFGGSLVALGLSLLEDAGPLPEWGTAAHLERLAECMVEMETIRQAGDVAGRIRFSRGTTHVDVADADGNVAAMSTSNGESAGYVVPGTGVMLNNMLGEDDLHPDGFHAAPPGVRVASMMAPTLVLDGDRVVLALGSGGSKRIRTALLQVISAVVDAGLSPADAVEAPRLHWDGEVLQVEPGFSGGSVAALERRWPVNRWAERNLYFGGVHALTPGVSGGGDPRRGGVAVDA